MPCGLRRFFKPHVLSSQVLISDTRPLWSYRFTQGRNEQGGLPSRFVLYLPTTTFHPLTPIAALGRSRLAKIYPRLV